MIKSSVRSRGRFLIQVPRIAAFLQLRDDVIGDGVALGLA
jgi:hypothetical protein